MRIFFDSSAFAKRYVSKEVTDAVLERNTLRGWMPSTSEARLPCRRIYLYRPIRASALLPPQSG
jgi:hypothetical protein